MNMKNTNLRLLLLAAMVAVPGLAVSEEGTFPGIRALMTQAEYQAAVR